MLPEDRELWPEKRGFTYFGASLASPRNHFSLFEGPPVRDYILHLMTIMRFLSVRQ